MENKKRIKLKKNRFTVILYRVLMLVTILVMIMSIVLFFFDDEIGFEKIFSEVMLCGGAMLCLSIPIFLEKKYKIFIPNYILIMLFLFIFAHFVLGEIYRVYDLSVVFDKILHTTSGVVVAMLSYSIVSLLNEFPKNKTKLSPLFVSLFAFCFTMTIEYVWELFEYLMDTLFNSNMQRWQDSLISDTIPNVNEAGEYIHSSARGNGLKDTMMDMFVNIFGALGVSVFGYIGMKLKPESWILNKVILTDGDINAMKETAPQIEVDRKPLIKKRTSLPLKYTANPRVMIRAQRRKRVYLITSELKRNKILERKKNKQKNAKSQNK